MVGRTNQHRIDAAIVEDPAVVRDLRGGGTRDFAGLKQARLVYIAQRDHLIVRQPLQVVHQTAGASPRTDHSNPDPIVRALDRGRSQTRTDREPCGSGEERAAIADHAIPPLCARW
jgi:hypothetical protein